MNEILRAIEAEQMRNDLPNFNVGDNVKLHVKVKEGNRERIQMFEGTVIKRQNGGLRETFTVRRAKLFYLRDRVGKAAKVKELLTR